MNDDYLDDSEVDLIIDSLISLMKEHKLKYYDVVSQSGASYRLEIVFNNKMGCDTIKVRQSPYGNTTSTIN